MTTYPEGAKRLIVCSPGTDEVIWEDTAASTDQVRLAVEDARNALDAWKRTPADARITLAKRFAELATRSHQQLADRISVETGKPRWESAAEAKLIPEKVKLAIDAYHERNKSEKITLPQGTGRVSYHAIGVMAVLGPFNFPAHLPNGHIVPALIAGNTVVFKPSEKTPGTGQLLCKLWKAAGLPDGVLRVVQGDGSVGADLLGCDVNGVLFTGSYRAGCSIHRALAGRPDVLLALEMGGNNPLVVHRASDLDAAAYLSVVSAYVTAGQRCTCARRLIVPEDETLEPLLDRIVRLCTSLRVGLPDADPEPFMGPLISTAAAQRALNAQSAMIRGGATALVTAERVLGNPALLRPGLIDVSSVADREDEEVFGPLLQLVRVPDFDAAIDEANKTAYGLSASLLSDDAALFEQFRHYVRAGVVNWNQPTIGASGRLPFGGLNASGNHRPSGFFASDYCSDATAIMASGSLSMPAALMPGIEITK